MNQEQIEQYVAGRMGEAEAQAFEEYCLANPEFARQVEYEQRLKAGIGAGCAAAPRRNSCAPTHPLRWSLAAAASVLIALVAVLSIWNSGLHARGPTHPGGGHGGSPHDGTSLRLALVRGSDSAPTLPPGWSASKSSACSTRQFITASRSTGCEPRSKIDTVATLNDQRPTSPVSLEVMIDSKQLRAGAYSLRVRKQASGEEALDFGFVKF